MRYNEGFDELEIRVFGDDRDSYHVELRLPDGLRYSSRVRTQDLRSLSVADPRNYGMGLFKWLFSGRIAKAFGRARSLASVPTRSSVSKLGIRLRLWLDPAASELQTFNWESLWDLEQDEPLTLNVAFSRYLRVEAPQRRTSPMGPLRMLLIVSNPLEARDLPAMIERLATSRVSRLWGERIRVRRLEDNPTLEQIRSAVADYHLVHLLAESVREGDKQYILLAREKGGMDQVPVPVVAEAMSTLTTSFPTMVFISAPLRDGWRGDEGVNHLGPVLIKSGAQVVVDIERPMNPDALARFTEAFYAEIMRNDIVDQATAIARRAVFGPSFWDWTAPVLYAQSQELQVIQQVSEEIEGTVVGVTMDKI